MQDQKCLNGAALTDLRYAMKQLVYTRDNFIDLRTPDSVQRAIDALERVEEALQAEEPTQ